MPTNPDDKGNINNTELTGASTRAADAVISKLEEQILSGTLPDSLPLPAERDLMKQFNISRTVVREAIATLSSRGLLESKPRFRPIVRKPDLTGALGAISQIVGPLLAQKGGVKNLFECRVFIERALVREAATSARKEDIQELREKLAANYQAIDDSDQFYETDIAFHRVLYQIPRNPVLPAVQQGFMSWLAPHWEKMLRSPDRNMVNYKSHEAILLAIEDRDPEGAEEALVNHMKAAWEFVRVTFDDAEL